MGKEQTFDIPFPSSLPKIQIIGTEEEFKNLFEWLEKRDRALIENTIQAVFDSQKDPLAGHPKVAPASYWVTLQKKSNVETYTDRAFIKWAKKMGYSRVKGGYPIEVAKAWLYR